ncbi:MAG: hypothetical protein IKB16_01775 [Lentisphaeria bacterium]|nr:hypothetical protein [Lentisphaeria bacterium]
MVSSHHFPAVFSHAIRNPVDESELSSVRKNRRSEAVKAMIELVSSGSREQPFQILVPAEVVNAEFI